MVDKGIKCPRTAWLLQGGNALRMVFSLANSLGIRRKIIVSATNAENVSA